MPCIVVDGLDGLNPRTGHVGVRCDLGVGINCANLKVVPALAPCIVCGDTVGGLTDALDSC